MNCKKLSNIKLAEARYDTFTRNIVAKAIELKDTIKVIIILRPEY